MWQIAAMAAVGAVSGVLEGDAIYDQADASAKDLEIEALRVRRNAFKEGKDTYVAEQLAGGTDSALEVTNNISTGMSESSAANQMLAANRAAAMRESQSIIDEGVRMSKLYQDRANTTRQVGKERAQKAIVNGIVSGAVSGYGLGKNS